MPEPGPPHANLARLAGTWRGDETLFPSPWSPEERTATGAFTARMGCDGLWLLSDYEESRDGAVFFRGHGVYGWDAARARYTMYWVDSMGGHPAETLGDWQDDVLTFSNQGAHGHGRYVYELDGADRYVFRILSSRDGEAWSPMMEGRYRRV
ncbi:MAG: DUF1579 family protein [Kofleriaceae bacterium]|nr:DUF1579 family protein [Kofleriaceae bacterium]